MKPLLWFMTAATVSFGILIVLWPKIVTKLNQLLNSGMAFDPLLIRFRYVVGLLLFVSGYLFFVLGLHRIVLN